MLERIDLKRARDALHAIPPDLPRDEWVRAGMAAQAAGLSFDDFNEWSAGAGNYEERAVRETWRSFKPGRGIGENTLYRMAAKHGGDGKRPSKAPARPIAAAKAPRPGMGAAEVWSRCRPATDAHPYIMKKDGRPNGLRVVPDGDSLRIAGASVAGFLVVPVAPLAGGEPTSLQFIPPPGEGKKLNLPGAPMAGAFVVGELEAGGTAFLCEGIGQAWSCWTATGAAAVVCFGWGRVRTVAAELRQRYPSARLVLVPDTGKEGDAEAIALEVGAELVTMPEGSPPNFDANDYAQAEGHDALELLLSGAMRPREPLPLPWRVVPVADLATVDIPPQAWAWRDYIPAGEVTLLGAHGGTGKSTLALMLGASAAMGQPLFGTDTQPGPVVFFSGEDGADTVRRRLQAIMRGLGLDAASLAERFEVLDATDAPELAALLPEASGKPGLGLTVVGQSLKDYMADRPGALLIVDNASDAFGGNENARAEVRAFVRLLAGMVRNTGGAVLLLAHVDKGTSRGNRAGGEGYSGSTAWHNSARSRLYLSREKESGALLLEHQKSNHGEMLKPLRLVWPRDGLPQVDSTAESAVQRIGNNIDAKALLRLIHDFYGRSEFVATDTRSRYHAAKVLGDEAAYPKHLKLTAVFKMLVDAERRHLLQRETYKDRNRKEHERWALTAAGCAHVGVAAPSAPCAPSTDVGALGHLAQQGAPSAPCGVQGVWGNGARTEVAAVSGPVQRTKPFVIPPGFPGAASASTYNPETH